jgi:hypothetical protein
MELPGGKLVEAALKTSALLTVLSGCSFVFALGGEVDAMVECGCNEGFWFLRNPYFSYGFQDHCMVYTEGHHFRLSVPMHSCQEQGLLKQIWVFMLHEPLGSG